MIFYCYDRATGRPAGSGITEIDTATHACTTAAPSGPDDVFDVVRGAWSGPISKLSLRRALRAAGLESALDAYLAANPTAKADWDDAQVLRIDDPMLVAAMPVLCQQAGLTEAQGMAMLEACRA